MYVCLVQYQRTGYNQQPAVVIVGQRERACLCLKERRDWKADALVRRPSVPSFSFLSIHHISLYYLSIGQWRARHGSRCCSSWWWWWWRLLKWHWCWCWQRPFSHATLLDRPHRRLLAFRIMQVFTVTLKTNSAGKDRVIVWSLFRTKLVYHQANRLIACHSFLADERERERLIKIDYSCVFSYRWQWSRFVRRSAAEINATIYSAPDPAMISGPLDDADGRPTGTRLH